MSEFKGLEDEKLFIKENKNSTFVTKDAVLIVFLNRIKKDKKWNSELLKKEKVLQTEE